MKQHIKNGVRVFFTAYLQVFLIIAQTKFVLSDQSLLVGVTAIGISTCWLFNVNGVILTIWHKVGYVLGCACGSLTGMYLIDIFLGMLV